MAATITRSTKESYSISMIGLDIANAVFDSLEAELPEETRVAFLQEFYAAFISPVSEVIFKFDIERH